MDYLLKILVYVYMRKEENNLCGFSITDTDFCVEIRISLYMWKEGGWVGDSPCGLSIKGTYSYIYVSHEFLIHPWPSLFFLQRGTCV